jgi:hypothetical protein
MNVINELEPKTNPFQSNPPNINYNPKWKRMSSAVVLRLAAFYRGVGFILWGAIGIGIIIGHDITYSIGVILVCWGLVYGGWEFYQGWKWVFQWAYRIKFNKSKTWEDYDNDQCRL